MRLVKVMGILLIVVAILLCFADSIFSLLLYLAILKQMLGHWARWVGLALSPLVIALFPFYALFALETWSFIVLTYGGMVASIGLAVSGSYLLRLSERAKRPADG
jgi:hypothetical protein